MPHRVSVLVLTKNEQAYIGRCLASLQWAEEIVVLDAASDDETRAVAAAHGAVVYEQAWLGYAAQRNRAAELASNDWVLFVDADEIVTTELARSIIETCAGELDPRDGYSVLRRGDFLGVLLPSGQRRSQLQVRLYNRRHSWWDPEQLVHECVVLSGRTRPLAGVLLHWRGQRMDEYVAAFNRYATLEAQMLSRRGARATAFALLYRPLLRFAWIYFARGGFRFGARGVMWAMLKANAEFVRYAKLWELEHPVSSRHPPSDLAATAAPADRARITGAGSAGSLADRRPSGALSRSFRRRAADP